MLRRRSERYSPEAILQIRRSIRQAIHWTAGWFGIFGALTVIFTWRILHGENFALAASICTALLICGVVPAIASFIDLFVTKPFLMPYFDAEVPGDGWEIGADLLEHSRALDGLAESVRLRRIGEFISDDDFYHPSGPTWHSASEALATFDALLVRFASDPDVQYAGEDLATIRDRLVWAESHGVQFCLLLTTDPEISARRTDRRKGYF